MRKKIAVVTSSRAEYGILYWLLKRLDYDKNIQLQLIATGAHLSKEFGNTCGAIKQDKFNIAAKADILFNDDSRFSMAKSVGNGVFIFAKIFNRLKPDILLILGDRFEIFSAAYAAKIMDIPIVHISGGDTTMGAIDNEFRHSISLASALHFVKLKVHKNKLLRLGIKKENVFVVGYSGLENLSKIKKMSKAEIEHSIKAPIKRPFALVTFHPVTNTQRAYDNNINSLLYALGEFKNLYFIFTGANQDSGGRRINRRLEQFVRKHPGQSIFIKNAGRRIYPNLMSQCNLLIGNSSSGILESAYFNVPVVNILPRQSGRIRNRNVIDCNNIKADLVRAIREASSPVFRNRCKRAKNIYQVMPPRQISKKIVSVIKQKLF